MQVASSLERTGGRIGLAHTIEVLDASIRGLGVESLGASPTSDLPASPTLPVNRSVKS
jgi:glycolate oxidase iron-sulfur subunit